jgi:hypothetical protein
MRWLQRILLLLVVTLLLTACQPVVEDPRPNGETLTYQVTDIVTSAFFQLQIEKFSVSRNLNDYIPVDRQALLLAMDLIIENSTDSSLPMSYADFQLIYKDDSGKEQIIYPLEPFLESQFPDTYTLENKDTKSGTLVFQIPKDLQQCHLQYQEIYEDDFLGNRHLIEIVLTD